MVCAGSVRLRGGPAVSLRAPTHRLVAFPLIASVIIGASGWRDAWIVLGILVFAIALLPTLLLIVQQPEDVGLRPDGDAPPLAGDEGQSAVTGFGPAPAPPAEEAVWTLREAMRTPALWMFATATGMVFLVQAGVNTHWPPICGTRGLLPPSRVWASASMPPSWAGQPVLGVDHRKFPAPLCPGRGGHDRRSRVSLVHYRRLHAEILVYAVAFGLGWADCCRCRRWATRITTGAARWG